MKPVLAITPIMAGLLAVTAHAQPPSNNEAAELRAELEALRERIDELEDTSATGRSLAFSGDLRYRHEMISDDAASTDRSRHRIRARFNVDAELGDDLTVGFTLATGSSNPVSANQSLDGGFTRKDIGFDRAWFQWQASDTVTLTGGKMENPIFRPGGHHLIFDSDLNPEGLALNFEGMGGVFASIGGFWVEERGSTDDAILYTLQGGYRAMIGDEGELTFGASYMNYENTQGFEPFYEGEAQGNSVDIDNNLIHDYDLVEVFAQFDVDVGGQPLRIFVDYVENQEADQFDTGYAFGARWRRASAPGSWDVAWAYQDLEADAVIATFTDSDFGGGGTDGKGHVIKGSYALRSNVRLNGTYFINEIGEAAGNVRDYDRLQLDISFRF